MNIFLRKQCVCPHEDSRRYRSEAPLVLKVKSYSEAHEDEDLLLR